MLSSYCLYPTLFLTSAHLSQTGKSTLRKISDEIQKKSFVFLMEPVMNKIQFWPSTPDLRLHNNNINNNNVYFILAFLQTQGRFTIIQHSQIVVYAEELVIGQIQRTKVHGKRCRCEIWDILRGETMESFKCNEEYFVLNMEKNR